MSARKDLRGKRFGKLTAISIAPTQNGNSYWNCKCDCGKEKIVMTRKLTSGNTKSCGCLKEKLYLVSYKYGNLTVLEEDRNSKSLFSYWICKCSCGNTKSVRGTSLLSGATTSCGCARKKNHKSPMKKFIEEDIPERKENLSYCKEYIKQNMWRYLRRGARKRNLEWSITKDDVNSIYQSQEGRCALSGVPIYLQGKVTTASLDRIDSSIGYIPSNVQWVHKEINFMKSNSSEEKFIKWCKLISSWE